MTLVIEIASPLFDAPRHHRIDAFPAFVGRAFDNDVILPDPYVSARHLKIEQDGGSWRVHDTGGENGLRHQKKTVQGGAVTVASGDSLRIGHTVLRFYAPGHAVAPTQPLENVAPTLLWLTRPRQAGLGVAAGLFAVILWAFLNIWTDQPATVSGIAGVAALGTIVVWATLWSAAGRLLHRRPAFSGHAALIGLYLAVNAFTWVAETYADFLFGAGVSAAFGYITSGAILFALVFGSLGLATWMTRRRRTWAAVLVALGLTLGGALLKEVDARAFSQTPPYSPVLKPRLAWLAPASSPDAFVDAGATLFSEKK